ncbi:MAG: ABC transporter substrate-binding protein [Xanthobacteraceae bacterium]
MKRREFMTGAAGAAAAWPLAARGQQPEEHMRLIGVLEETAEDDKERNSQFAKFREGLASLGWLEGRTVHYEHRFAAADAGRYEPLAKELVALQPEVILAVSTPVTAALQRQTSTIPIVFLGVSDPIGSGFAANLARPGKNLTGIMLYEVGIAGKWLAMLKEIAPRLTRVALVAGPKTTAYNYFVRNAEAAAPSLGIEIVPTAVSDAADIERGIEAFSRVPNGGLLLPSDGTTIVHRDLVIALAARHNLPAVYALRAFVTAGGLMSYSTELDEAFQQAASLVDRILRGAKPIDLPVQTPTKYQTSLNLKTAKALGLTVPPALLVAADEVVE